MRVASKIDEQRHFLEDVLLEDAAPLPAGCIESRPPEGFHVPMWTGSGWTEGKPEGEILEAKKAAKIDEFAARGIDDLAPLFTPNAGRDETMLLLAGHVLKICEALSIPADPRLSEVVATGEKALLKKAEIEAAASLEELEAVEWTP